MIAPITFVPPRTTFWAVLAADPGLVTVRDRCTAVPLTSGTHQGRFGWPLVLPQIRSITVSSDRVSGPGAASRVRSTVSVSVGAVPAGNGLGGPTTTWWNAPTTGKLIACLRT